MLASIWQRLVPALAVGLLPGVTPAAPLADFSRTAVRFEYQTRGAPSPAQPVFVTNVGDAPLTISMIALGGSRAADYGFAGTCGPPIQLAPGERCHIDVVMTPVGVLRSPSPATLTVTSDGVPATQDIALTGFIDPGNATPVTPSALFWPAPQWIDFPAQPVGTTSAPVTMIITNQSVLTWTINRFGAVGRDAADFTVTSSCAIGSAWAYEQACTATVTFHPQAAGPRSTELSTLLSWTMFDSDYRYSLTGVGTLGAPAPVTVVEYYNAALDHYFITWLPAEQANLDAGNTPTRWTRTGYTFRVYTSAATGSSPVCRYYLPPQYGDSHFFGRGTRECNDTGAAHPQFVLEDSAFMHVFLPDAGACPAATTPVYRAFSNRADANHRYMIDRAVRDQMVARGWLAEGDGPDRVVMCAV